VRNTSWAAAIFAVAAITVTGCSSETAPSSDPAAAENRPSSRESSLGNLCFAYQNATKEFESHTIVYTPQGVRVLEKFVEFAKNYPSEVVQYEAGQMAEILSRGSLDVSDFTSQTQNIKAECQGF
jgi:hypothetical protein